MEGSIGPDSDWALISDEQREMLRRWATVKSATITREEWLGDGTSGVPVAVATIRMPHLTRHKVILRFYERDSREIKRALLAQDQSPFCKKHIPQVETVTVAREGPIAYFDVAGQDSAVWRPLVEAMDRPDLPAHLQGMITSILRDWNTPPPPGSDVWEGTAEGYLARMIHGWSHPRSDPGARLLRWASENGIAATQERLPWSRKALLNPLAVLGADPNSSRRLHFLAGRAHGDLNVRNIFLKIDSELDGTDYQLIDLGGFDSHSPLARDPMHLLLSITAEWIRDYLIINDNTGPALINALLDPTGTRLPQSNDFKGHREISNAIHQAGREVASAHGFGGEWTAQTMLSLAGCALLFADRDLRMRDEQVARTWFFTLAASALDRYFELAPAARPDTARLAQEQGPQAVPEPVGPAESQAATESCSTIAHLLNKRTRSASGLHPEQLALLLADYGSRAPLLTEDRRVKLAAAAMGAFSPPSVTSAPRVPRPRRTDVVRSHPDGQEVDVAVLTTDAAEFRAVLAAFGATAVDSNADREGSRRVAVEAPRLGRPLSVQIVRVPERLRHGGPSTAFGPIEELVPHACVLVGSARGHRRRRLGDVVVPAWVGRYTHTQAGIITPAAPVRIPEHIRTLLAYYEGAPTLFEDLAARFLRSVPGDAPPRIVPRVVLGDAVAVASGDPELLDSVTPDDLHGEDPRLEAVDTESYEFGTRNAGRLWAVLRGIVVDSTDDAQKFLAAGVAAACLRDFLEHDYLPTAAYRSAVS
ncbi:hypothetical protein NIE79_005227 [Micromonospora sp. NIE79]|uniref:Aminoglycoside phosphotransferase domain-containing protein n=1 Tax=Micromonospora trifolii TaxID=2911208 RepID=A0ABS9N9L0_9ACTN|nr:hypothetical protein [Micromonospora trifolii]MCG5446528.1 hypothetical protein [Micromonospora trifolii]